MNICDNNFKCDSKILGVLASGAVVPCCLAYDEKISMGKIQEQNLKSIMENNLQFLKNLRTKNYKKEETCKKCFGEPSKRGVFFRNLYNKFPETFKQSKLVRSLVS